MQLRNLNVPQHLFRLQNPDPGPAEVWKDSDGRYDFHHSQFVWQNDGSVPSSASDAPFDAPPLDHGYSAPRPSSRGRRAKSASARRVWHTRKRDRDHVVGQESPGGSRGRAAARREVVPGVPSFEDLLREVHEEQRLRSRELAVETGKRRHLQTRGGNYNYREQAPGSYNNYRGRGGAGHQGSSRAAPVGSSSGGPRGVGSLPLHAGSSDVDGGEGTSSSSAETVKDDHFQFPGPGAAPVEGSAGYEVYQRLKGYEREMQSDLAMLHHAAVSAGLPKRPGGPGGHVVGEAPGPISGKDVAAELAELQRLRQEKAQAREEQRHGRTKVCPQRFWRNELS